MKCFVAFVFLSTWAAAPVIADEPKVESKTIPLWDQEQDRLRHKIEELQKQLEAAEELLQNRTANRDQYEKQSLEAEQQKVPKETGQPANVNAQNDSDRLLPEFETPPTWEQFFEALCTQHKIELEADGYPPGTVDLQKIKSLTEDTLLMGLSQELRSHEFDLWLVGNKLKISKQPPKGHPLLGMWESTKVILAGKPSDEQVQLLFTRRIGILFEEGETDTFNYAVTLSEPGLNPEIELCFQEEGTFLRGSFKVEDAQAEILWGEVTAEGLPFGEMVFMKLQLIE